MRTEIRGLLAGWLLAAALIGLGGCKRPTETIKDDLQEAGYQVTPEDWLRASRENNVVAMKKFVAGGFAVDTRDAAGDSALHVAASAGAQEAADYLLNRGLSVDLRGAEERTPLMAAVLANQPKMVRWLLGQGAAPRLKDREGYSPIMLAVRSNSTKVVGELAIYTREDLDVALLVAALEGRAEMIDTLTKYGASVYARMDDGRTPLMLAAQGGHADAAKMLMELGSSRFTATEDGSTAADFAQTEGHPEIAELILAQPVASAWSIESPEEIASAMESYVDAAAADGEDIPTDSSPPQPTGARAKPVSLAGQTLAAAPGTGSSSGSAAVPPATGSAKPLPLIMRHYREHEMPLEVRTVSGSTATLRMAGKPPREVNVKVGETVPDSNLTIVQVKRRMKSGKGDDGRLTEVSVVEFKDTRSGATRELIVGVPASSHDPVALVEDATTGQRYTATPGQRFRGGDGAEYQVNDVSPNQISIENTATGDVQTLPLRGPRG
jgi:ankyrin repeat protein